MAAPMTQKVRVEVEASDSASDADFEESGDSSESEVENSSDEEVTEPVDRSTEKSGLADVLAKILHKNVPAHKQVILSKGKTDKEIQKRKLEREQEEEEDTGKKSKLKTPSSESHLSKEEKVKIWENMCRSKPDPLDRDKERQLQKIATRGVVQLFNAVRKQQKVLEDQIQQVGSSERKKEKVLEGMTRDKFLSILKGTSNTNVKTEKPDDLEIKPSVLTRDNESDSKNTSGDKTWNILKDDYMMGAKMKDWGQEGTDDENDNDDNSGPDDPDLSDSD